MPYYAAGDYYQGDYYQGDNYAAGGLFGSILKGIGGAAKGFLTGGPLGAVRGAISGVRGGPSIAPTVGMALIPSFGGPGQGQVLVPEPGITGAAHRFFKGGKTGYGRYTKDGRFTERRRPRMDVGNMKALRRANRRAHGFLRAYRSAVSYYVAKAPKGKAYVHFKKRK